MAASWLLAISTIAVRESNRMLNHARPGLTIALPGPTILDLQIAAGSSLDQVARILPSRAGGYAVGAIISESWLD